MTPDPLLGTRLLRWGGGGGVAKLGFCGRARRLGLKNRKEKTRKEDKEDNAASCSAWRLGSLGKSPFHFVVHFSSFAFRTFLLALLSIKLLLPKSSFFPVYLENTPPSLTDSTDNRTRKGLDGFSPRRSFRIQSCVSNSTRSPFQYDRPTLRIRL